MKKFFNILLLIFCMSLTNVSFGQIIRGFDQYISKIEIRPGKKPIKFEGRFVDIINVVEYKNELAITYNDGEFAIIPRKSDTNCNAFGEKDYFYTLLPNGKLTYYELKDGKFQPKYIYTTNNKKS